MDLLKGLIRLIKHFIDSLAMILDVVKGGAYRLITGASSIKLEDPPIYKVMKELLQVRDSATLIRFHM